MAQEGTNGVKSGLAIDGSFVSQVCDRNFAG